MSIQERIKFLYEVELRISQKEFCINTGLNNSAISNMYKRNTKPSAAVLIAIVDSYKKLNARWLLLGTGEIWDNGKKYSELSDGKNMVNEGLGTYKGAGDSEKRIKELERINDLLINQLETLQKVINRL